MPGRELPMNGALILAKRFKEAGISTVFAVVGIPVVQFAKALQVSSLRSFARSPV